MSEPQFAGVPFFLNGREYLIPALSLGQVKKHYATLEQMTNLGEGKTVLDVFDASVPVIGDAIRRNYPEVTDEQLFDWIDVGNFHDIAGIIQAAAGFKAVKPGEVPAPASTGATSAQP